MTVDELGHQSIWDWAQTPMEMFVQITGQQSDNGNFWSQQLWVDLPCRSNLEVKVFYSVINFNRPEPASPPGFIPT